MEPVTAFANTIDELARRVKNVLTDTVSQRAAATKALVSSPPPGRLLVLRRFARLMVAAAFGSAHAVPAILRRPKTFPRSTDYSRESMSRRDWLILLLAYQGRGAGPGLDPVRVQKGMFLTSQEATLPADQKYEFRAHHYGPYSDDLKWDLNSLVREGVVAEIPVPGYTWSRYELTGAGLERARQLLDIAPIEAQHQLFGIKQRITGVSFNDLLRDVYAKYPDYATNSIFSG